MLLALYSTTVFVSAALLLWVHPLMGKLVLPMLGGTPETWNTCMVFFQAMLLAGYAYAHWTIGRLGVRRQAILHCVLILLPVAALPIGIGAELTPPSQGTPVGWLLLLLTVSVGAPFLAVSATAPLVQRWFAETGHASAGDPYFLYSASNLGSMLSLAAFPLVLEPTLRLSQQARAWSAGYGLLVLMLMCCAMAMLRTQPREKTSPTVPLPQARKAQRVPLDKAVEARRRWRWVGLSFVGSSWLLGVTAYITTDIAPVPLLWIIPLALYLLSFILVFARRPLAPLNVLVRYFPLLLLLLVAPILFSGSGPALVLHLIAFFWGLLVCHGLLARDRPGTDHLTEYYLLMSLGGVLGGVLHGLIAPLVFRWQLEYPLTIALAAWLVTSRQDANARLSQRARLIALAAITLLMGLLVRSFPATERPLGLVIFVALALPALAALFALARWRAYCLVLGTCLVAAEVAAPFNGQVLYTGRGYFGVHRVLANQDEQRVLYHHLVHGSTVHGRQARLPSRTCDPLTYYHRTGPLGDLFAALPPQPNRRVAIVGLGTGAMICYARPGDEFTFYEIDPLVQQIAETPAYFSFLSECCQGRYEIVLGDGRLQLAATSRQYDVMIFDAFSSDAVPVHLLTREALAMYLSKLAPDGVLVFHASNMHLDLSRVLAALAAELKLVCLARADVQITDSEFQSGKTSSTYVALARSPEDLGTLADHPHWRPPLVTPGTPIWTDNYSNILGALMSQR